MNTRSLLAVTFLAILPCPRLFAADYYVAADGKDAWSGTLAAPNQERSDGPFATLERARDAVRARKQSGSWPEGGIAVEVLAGSYELPRTFLLTADDSGRDGAPVMYRAREGAEVRLLGGRRVVDFVPLQGEVLKADLARQGLKGVHFTQLLFDGQRQPLARYPNLDRAAPHGGKWAYVEGERISIYQDVVDEKTRTERKWNESVFVQRPDAMQTLPFKEADERHWQRPQEAEVFIFPRFNWVSNLRWVESVDPEKRTLRLNKPTTYEIRPGDRYFVRGPREELDAPGEWYRDDEAGQLLFWPPEPLAGGEVVAPTLQTVIELRDGAEDIVVRGFTIQCCEGHAVVLRDVSGCVIAGNTISAVGGPGGNGISVVGGRHNRVEGNDIHHTGSHGVLVSGGDPETLTGADHEVVNNYIHHPGVLARNSSAIAASGVGHRVAHNLIHDCPRKAIQFIGNNLIIEYNRIRHTNLETEDTGAIGTSGRNWLSSRGSAVRYNFITDSLGYGWRDDRWSSPYFDFGIYLDDNTGGVDIIGNVVARTGQSCMHLHNARDNRIENNIFIDGGKTQIQYSGWTPEARHWKNARQHMIEVYEKAIRHPAWKAMRNMDLNPRDAVLPDGKIMAGNVVRRNIFCYRDPEATLFKERNFPFDHNESDYNLVWNDGHTPRTGQTHVKGVSGPNLAPNPGFETGEPGAMPADWHWQMHPEGGRSAAIDREQAASGAQSLRIEGAAGPDSKDRPAHPVIVSGEFPAVLGQAYVLTARMRADQPGRRAALKAQSFVANVYFWYSETKVTLGPDWQEVRVNFRFPKPGDGNYKPEMKNLVARVDLLEGEGTLWVDDIDLRAAEMADEWESWQATGLDSHSQIVDPQFVDPGKDDYRLKPDSPAFGLGFEPIPFEKIGPYADPLRATWPIVEAKGYRELVAGEKVEAP